MSNKKKVDRVILSKDSPHESARKFRELRRPNLICLEGEWLDYDQATGAYTRITKKSMRAEVAKFLILAGRRETYKEERGNPETKKIEKIYQERVVPFTPRQVDIVEVYEALD